MGKLICPLCGAFTSPTLVTFSATVVYETGLGISHRKGSAKAVTPDITGQPTYGIMTCQSCDRWFVAEKVGYNKWRAVYPIQHKSVAEEIPDPIHSDFEEANLCFAIGAYRACVTMCMAALEALWREQNASNLDDLKEKGAISQRLFDQAREIRLWAGIVKHELIYETITKEETEELQSYLEEILHDVYVRPARLGALAEKRGQLAKGNR